MTDDQFIQIGLVIKPHGLRGEVCVEYFADSPFFIKGQPVWLKCGKGPLREHTVFSTRTHKGRELLLLEDARDRNAAETLRNCAVYVPKEELPELSEEEVYLHSLEGLRVILEHNGSTVGHIESFQFNAGSEVWGIRTEDGKEVLFPATEQFVAAIDLDAGTVAIAPPEGLLELYLESSE